MFLGRQRDFTRVSTPVANQPLHLCPVREVTTRNFTVNWEEVDYGRLSQMIAHTSHQIYQDWAIGKKKKDSKVPVRKEVTSTESPQQVAYLASSRHLDSSAKAKFNKIVNRLRSEMTKLFKKTLATTLGDDPHDIQGFFKEFQQGLQDLVGQSSEGKGVQEILVSHSIRIIDSGGQPQFHDLLSIFIPELSGLITVFKLSEPLAVRGEVVFYKDGKQTCTPYKSHYTNEQVIRHDLQVIQSEAMRCGVEHMPNLAFVGTHYDLKDLSTETPDKKDELLHDIITEMLPENMQESVISAGRSLSHVTFQINAREPGKDDFKKVDELKKILLDKSRVQLKELPLKWYGYEVALHLLMQSLGRQCLGRKECEFVGHKLGFDAPSLNAALEYLRQLNILSFFDILPDVVFGSSQVILDKITELVTYNLELKDCCGALTGAQRKFVQQGIVSIDILKSHKLSKHYIKDLFEPKHLLNILISKLVVTKVSKDEFLMPCVMEVTDINPTPPPPRENTQSSFIFHFHKKIPMIGIYCCTISSLITDGGWKLLKENGEVVLVSRNGVSFEAPQELSGRLTFLDPLSSFLQLVVELPAAISAEHRCLIYHEIWSTLSASVKQALHTLNYKVMAPELSFLCPGGSGCSNYPHLAKVDKSCTFLTCSIKPRSVSDTLNVEQKIWLSCSGEKYLC